MPGNREKKRSLVRYLFSQLFCNNYFENNNRTDRTKDIKLPFEWYGSSIIKLLMLSKK
jgi:hypothetical protein